VVGGMAADVPLEDVFRGVFYFIPAYLVCLAVLMLFPEAITALPRLMR
jgi:TRAP-type C4-dicarboxylate transport system permease large subunit